MESEGHTRRRVLRAAGLALVATPALNLTGVNRASAGTSAGSPTIGELGKTLTENLGVVLRGGPDQPLPPGTFLTWCRPGIPMQAGDLDFAEDGVFSAGTPEGQKALSNHAFAFSTLMDYVPSIGADYTNARQETSYSPAGGVRLSELYGQILKAAKVVHHDLTDEEKARLDRCRNFLTTTVKAQDLMTGATVDKTQPSPQAKAYDAARQEWLVARTNRGNKLAAARAAHGEAGLAAISDWETNAEVYDQQVQIAEHKWSAEGYRNEVDSARAIIDQVTERDMSLWLASLKSRFEKGRLQHVDSGTDFPYTTIVPGNVATSAGWTTYEHTHEHRSIATHEETVRWNAGAGAGFGLWSIGANAGGEHHDVGVNVNCASFTLSVELAQAVLVRPWFYPEFFLNRGWTLNPGDGWNFDGMPSDGQDPPHGLLIGFPTQIILARNLTITSTEFASAYRDATSSFTAGGSVGWGPFRLSGGYHRDTHDTSLDVQNDGKTIRTEGMQIIGFVNHMIGKAPNPLPSIPASAFL